MLEDADVCACFCLAFVTLIFGSLTLLGSFIIAVVYILDYLNLG